MSIVESVSVMNKAPAPQTEKKFTGKHFLISILSFFGVIIGMNMAFVYFATNTWTGLSKENAYVDGLNYNQTIEAAKLQRELNWQSSLELLPQGTQKLVSFTLQDQNNQHLSGFDVTVKIGRPTLQGYDQTLVLAESSYGQYGAIVDLPLKGQWHVSLSATAPDGTPFQLEKRFFVK
ncbi:FixH family protein [Kiloniella litopenaei]|uniref:FixH family protein n=1 Tax=Kiloniella litopenaei TaxID=1549748 RepID=UPI003BAB4AD9